MDRKQHIRTFNFPQEKPASAVLYITVKVNIIFHEFQRPRLHHLPMTHGTSIRRTSKSLKVKSRMNTRVNTKVNINQTSTKVNSNHRRSTSLKGTNTNLLKRIDIDTRRVTLTLKLLMRNLLRIILYLNQETHQQRTGTSNQVIIINNYWVIDIYLVVYDDKQDSKFLYCKFSIKGPPISTPQC